MATATTGRVSLRDYQRALSERLQHAEAGASLPSKLAVRVNGEGWLIALQDAGEVIPVPALSAVPLARSWFKGLANVRGNLYSVTDFAAFLGGEPLRPSMDARLVLLNDRFRCQAALLVERSLGLRSAEQLAPQPETAELPFVRRVHREADGRTWKELDVDALVQHDAFLEVSL